MQQEIEQFIQSVRRRNPKAHTARNYACDLRFFVTVVGDVPPEQIAYRDIDRFVQAQIERGYKPCTINRHLGTIVALYHYLGLACPVIARRHRMKEPLRLARPLTQDEMDRFFAVIRDPRDRAMFTLMRYCGLRISEVAELKLADVRFPRIIVNGKGTKERIVYATVQTKQALQDYLIQRPPAKDERLFLSYEDKGLSTTAIHKRLMIYRAQSGVSITAHRLRHSFATELLGAGAPVTSIQKLMGHSKIKTTQNYLQINNEQVRADYLSASQRIRMWRLKKGGDPLCALTPRLKQNLPIHARRIHPC